MGRIITLKYQGVCADCGAMLPVGSKARWYGRGRVYGLHCHTRASGNGTLHDAMLNGDWGTVQDIRYGEPPRDPNDY